VGFRLLRLARREPPFAPPPRDDGFTILEVMVSFMLLAMMMVVMASVFHGSLRTAGHSNRRTAASSLATREIENILAVPYKDVGFYTDQFGTVPTNTVILGPTAPAGVRLTPSGTARVGTTNFTIARTIVWQNASAAQTDAYKRAVVRITWSDDTQTHVVTQDSLVYPGGCGVYVSKNSCSGPTATVSAPGAPGACSTSSPGPTSITTSWGASTGTVGSYQVDWATTSTFSPVAGTSGPLGPSVLSFTPTTLASSTTYYFRVYAFSPSGAQSLASTACTGTTTAASIGDGCSVETFKVTGAAGSSVVYRTAGKLTEDLTITLNLSGSCSGSFKANAVLQSTNAEWPPGSQSIGGGGNARTKTVSTNNVAFAAGTYTVTLLSSNGDPVSPAVTNSFKVCDSGAPSC